MKKDRQIERRFRERKVRREMLHRRRHKRNVMLGVCAGVFLLLAGSFVIRHFMTSSSAVDTHIASATSLELIQESKTSSKEAASVSIDYKTRAEMEQQKAEPRQEKMQHDGYTDTLDTYLQVSRDTTLFTRDSTKSHVVAPIAKDTYVETYGKKGDWTKVVTKGRTGYVRNNDLAVVSDASLFKTVDGHVIVNATYAPNTDPRLENHFENTPQFRWLKKHAQEYGFVLRYPKGSETITGYRADPTIFYYVGVEDASIISNEGLTMEVFYGVH